MLVMARIAGGIGRPGLTSDSNTTSRRAAADHHHRDLGDPVAAERAHARRLHVHHREGALLRAAGILAPPAPGPSAVRDPADARIRSQQRHRDPVADHDRRPAQTEDLAAEHGGRLRPRPEDAVDPLDQRGARVRGEPDHRAARRSGSDMQRGPPPPRASSAPSTVITVRCLASRQSSKARKLTAGTTRKPAASSSHSVASLRR